MSAVKFRYDQNYSFIKKGIKHTIKENVIDGDKGLSVMFLHKQGEDSFYKLYAKEVEKDKYEIIEKNNEIEEAPITINEKELLKKLKDRKLETIINYINKDRGTYKGTKVSKVAIKLKGY